MKKANWFIVISCIFLTFMVTYYGGRMVYFYCLSKQAEKVGEVFFSTILHNKSYDSAIVVEENNLYYKGNVLNNYVYYSNRYFRILGLEDNHILLVDESSTILPFNGTFEDSEIYTWLNKTYLSTLNNSNQYLEKTTTCMDKDCQTKTESMVGLLSISQYEKAYQKGNYLNNKSYFWLADGRTVDIQGNVLEHSEGLYGVRAVIKLKKDVAYYGGTGTYYDPYFIDIEDAGAFGAASIPTVKVGSYIDYSGKIWRVNDIQDTIQLVAVDSIGKWKFSTKHNQFDLKDKTSIAYYLNHTFLEELDKTYLKEGEWAVGSYVDSYLDQAKEKITAYVGLPKMGDLFLTDHTDYFLLTNTGKQNTVYKVVNGMLYADSYQSENDIYPVIHLDKNINIKEGYGTSELPFVVGEA